MSVIMMIVPTAVVVMVVVMAMIVMSTKQVCVGMYWPLMWTMKAKVPVQLLFVLPIMLLLFLLLLLLSLPLLRIPVLQVIPEDVRATVLNLFRLENASILQSETMRRSS
jgi:hypothetical protein